MGCVTFPGEGRQYGHGGKRLNAGLMSFVEQLDACLLRGDRHAAEKRDEARNVACLKALYGAIARRDFAAAFAQLDDEPQYSIYSGGPIPFQMTGRGRREVEEGVRSNFSTLSFDAVDVDTLVAQGDEVVIILRQRGVWLESGVAFDERAMLQFRFRGGRVAHYRGWVLPFAP